MQPIIISSYFINIVVCLLIAGAGIAIFSMTMNFLSSIRAASPKIFSFAFFWLFAGLIWLTRGISPVFFLVSSNTAFLKYFDLASYHIVILMGLSLTFYISYKISYNFKIAAAYTLFVFLCGVFYSYAMWTGKWAAPVLSDWGHYITPPKIIIEMSILFATLFSLAGLFDYLYAVYLWLKKRRERPTLNNFIISLAIALLFFSGIFDLIGMPGWQLVYIRIAILVSTLLVIIAIYDTDYLESSIKTESAARNLNRL